MKKRLSIIPLSRYLLAIAVMLLGSLPLPAYAIDIPFFQSNDILYYDGSKGNACTTVGTQYSTDKEIPGLTGSDNAEKIWNYLKQQGFTDEQAAGVMGNIRQESGYDPNLEENNGVGYGIVQWSGGRRTDLENAAEAARVPVSDLGFQLGFMTDELKNLPLYNWRDLYGRFNATKSDNLWDLMKEQKTIEDAMVLFHDGFERSNDYNAYGGLAHRLKFANEDYERFTGKSASASTAEMNCRVQSAAGSGDLIATLLEYAHPEYHEPGFITMMPAYAQAVKKAQLDGRGVGGIAHPGIDCAGFVSLLLVDSGFDPEYNSKGKYATPGSTGEAIQRSWMEQHWEQIGKGGSADVNVADLRPGDVAVTRQGSGEHIFLHVGEISGFGNIFASASLDNRAPMAAGSYENAIDPSYDWFRKK